MLPQKRALILEDDPVIALDVEAELQDADWEVSGIAHNTAAALEILKHHQPQVALLDINLGRETSFGFARICKQDGIKIIFMSGYASTVLPEDLSAETILRKPIQMSRLLQLMASIV